MRPGDIWKVTFALSGAATGTPTAKLLHNGVEDTTVGSAGVITASAGADSNEWLITVTIPASGYAANDTIEISATATVASVTSSAIVRSAYIDPPVVATSVTGNVGGNVVGSVASVTAAITLPSGVATSASQATILTALGTPAQASQIPANFTSALFASAGVYAAAASAPGTAAIVAAMASAPVGSVANLAGVQLSGGTVSASPSPASTTFTATGASLNTTSGGYTTAPMSIFWQTGANTGFRYSITGHVVSGSNHAFTVGSAMASTPVSGDTFVIL